MTHKKCPLCNKEYEGYGNYGAPVIESKDVCDDCNMNQVIPARINVVKQKEVKLFEHNIYTMDGTIKTYDELKKEMMQLLEDDLEVMEYLEDNDRDRYDWLQQGYDIFSVEPEWLLEKLDYNPKDEYYRNEFNEWLSEKAEEAFEELHNEGTIDDFHGYTLENFSFESEKEELTREELIFKLKELRLQRFEENQEEIK